MASKGSRSKSPNGSKPKSPKSPKSSKKPKSSSRTTYTNLSYLKKDHPRELATIVARADRLGETAHILANSGESVSLNVIDDAILNLTKAGTAYLNLLEATPESAPQYEALNLLSAKSIVSISKLKQKRDMITFRDEDSEFNDSEKMVMNMQNMHLSHSKRESAEDVLIREKIRGTRVIRPCGFMKFSDYAGGKDIYEWFDTHVLNRFRHPQFQKDKKLQAVLLYGPPGTGKTLFPQCVAGELQDLDPVVFSISAADIKNSFYSKSEIAMKILFEEADQASIGKNGKKGSRPVIIFFDEIDGLVPNPQQSSSDIGAGLLAEFNRQVDGLGAMSGNSIILIGATNAIELLPENALSRFSSNRKFIGFPTLSNIRELFMTRFRKMGKSRVDLDIIDWDRDTHVLEMEGYINEVHGLGDGRARRRGSAWDTVDVWCSILYAKHYVGREIAAILEYMQIRAEARGSRFFSMPIEGGGSKVEYQKWILDRQKFITDEVNEYGQCTRKKEVSKYTFIPIQPTVYSGNVDEEKKFLNAIKDKPNGRRIGHLFGEEIHVTSDKSGLNVTEEILVPKYNLDENVRVVVTERTLSYRKQGDKMKPYWTYRLVRRQEHNVNTIKSVKQEVRTTPYNPSSDEDISDRMSVLIGPAQITEADFYEAYQNIHAQPIRNAANMLKYAQQYTVSFKKDSGDLAQLKDIVEENKDKPEGTTQDETAAYALARAIISYGRNGY